MGTKKKLIRKNKNYIKNNSKSKNRSRSKSISKSRTRKRSNKMMVKKGGRINLIQTNEFHSFSKLNNNFINVITQQNILLGQIICMKIFLENLVIVTFTHIYYFNIILRPNTDSNIIFRDKRSTLYGDLCERIEISKPSNNNTFILFYMSGKFEVFTIDKSIKKIIPIITAASSLIQKNHNLVSLAKKSNNNNLLCVAYEYVVKLYDDYGIEYRSINKREDNYKNIMIKTYKNFLVQLAKYGERYIFIFNDLNYINSGTPREYVYDNISEYTNRIHTFDLYLYDGILYLYLILENGDPNNELSYKQDGLAVLNYNQMASEEEGKIDFLQIADQDVTPIPIRQNMNFIIINEQVIGILIEDTNKHILIMIDFPLYDTPHLSWKVYSIPLSKKKFINLFNINPSNIYLQDTFLISFLFNDRKEQTPTLEFTVHQPDICVKPS
jgi:hypothetical protein